MNTNSIYDQHSLYWLDWLDVLYIDILVIYILIYLVVHIYTKWDILARRHTFIPCIYTLRGFIPARQCSKKNQIRCHLNNLNLLITYSASENRDLRFYLRLESITLCYISMYAYRWDSHLEAVSHNMPKGSFSQLTFQSRL